MLADFIVLSDDVGRVPSRALISLAGEQTYAGGKLVYSRKWAGMRRAGWRLAGGFEKCGRGARPRSDSPPTLRRVARLQPMDGRSTVEVF
jgi:hypothetical protein